MKFKVKQQQDKTIVQALIFKNEELVERELNTISLNAAKNFLRPTLKKRSFIYHYTIDFVGPRSVPLSQYLRNVISKQNFYHILWIFVIFLSTSTQMSCFLSIFRCCQTMSR